MALFNFNSVLSNELCNNLSCVILKQGNMVGDDRRDNREDTKRRGGDQVGERDRDRGRDTNDKEVHDRDRERDRERRDRDRKRSRSRSRSRERTGFRRRRSRSRYIPTFPNINHFQY